jgi:hypothetical protein
MSSPMVRMSATGLFVGFADIKLGLVIVVVEGPSAAGKTTWCRSQPWPVVAEYSPTGNEPDGSDDALRAAFWVGVNSARWQQAAELDVEHEVVLCDGDPMKLHYSWSLARIGAAPWSRFDCEFRHARAALADGRLGMADLVLVSVPPTDVLQARRAADTTRRRRSFDVHVELAAPLREWYTAVDQADPGAVVWGWPAGGVPLESPKGRRLGSPALLDRVVETLPR